MLSADGFLLKSYGYLFSRPLKAAHVCESIKPSAGTAYRSGRKWPRAPRKRFAIVFRSLAPIPARGLMYSPKGPEAALLRSLRHP